MYRTLEPAKVTATIEALTRRIGDRFPNAGLYKVSCDLIDLSRQSTARVVEVCRPHWGLRIGLAVVQVISLVALYFLYEFASTLKGSDQLSDFLEGFDAAISLAIFIAGAAYFVWSLEGRWKRGKALKALHELRTIVHVIDMHQLTKDPSMLGAARTSSSPDRQMSPFELMRYLDYCSEMLSLVAKIAALYAENIDDPVVVDTVGDIERLTSALSTEIWQKISMVQQLEGRDMPLPLNPPPPPRAINPRP